MKQLPAVQEAGLVCHATPLTLIGSHPVEVVPCHLGNLWEYHLEPADRPQLGLRDALVGMVTLYTRACLELLLLCVIAIGRESESANVATWRLLRGHRDHQHGMMAAPKHHFLPEALQAVVA